MGCSFVEDKNGRVLQQRAGDGDALALSTTKTDATVADDRVVAFGQTLDEFVGKRIARGSLDVFQGVPGRP